MPHAVLSAEVALGDEITSGGIPAFADFLKGLARALDNALLPDYCALLLDAFTADCADWQGACAGTGVTCP